MGDLMHALPALTDAAARFPDIEFDWVVDESFAEVPLWHPAVKNVIKTAHRRWKKNLKQSISKGELKSFYQTLRQRPYDAIVDMQGNLKSAVVSWLSPQAVNGYDKNSCREQPAQWAYRYAHPVSKQLHAVERQRQLMAAALGYSLTGSPPDYGVDLSQYPSPDLKLPDQAIVFVHNASKPEKMWPLEHWQKLLAKVTEQGTPVLLPCGNEEEHTRAKAIAGDNPLATALPKMSLNSMAAILSRAKAAVCSDTGLAHMAAVAKLPAITLYAVTDTRLIGTEGQNQHHIVANNQGPMAAISVAQVWQQLQELTETS